MTAKATAPPLVLSNLMKAIATQVISAGGVVRSIDNLGTRTLPYRFKSKFADRNGIRYHYDGRFVAVRFDASPGSMAEVERIVKLEEEVLRYTTTRPEEIEAASKVNKWKKNPWLAGEVDRAVRNLKHLSEEEEKTRKEEKAKAKLAKE